MKITTLAFSLVASVALAAPAPQAPPLATPASGCCASGAFTVTFLQQGETVKVRIKDNAEGWTWESPAVDGKVVPHKHGETSCQATVQDMDADQQPEVVVSIADGAPGGAVYVWKKDGRAFRAIPVEVGPGVGTRDFLVWDLAGDAPEAPVKVTSVGHVEVRGHLFSLLGQSTGEGTFRWRVSRGMMRHVETVARKP